MKYQTTLAIGLLLSAVAVNARAQETAPAPPSPEAATTAPQSAQELEQLKKRVDELEKAAKTPAKPSVETASKESTLKIDGRMFVGFFETGTNGQAPKPSFDEPDAKLRFTFNPSKDVTVVNRLSLSRAAVSGLDYFYIDLKNVGGFLPNQTLRIGKHKIDVGQETWSDNPIENILITNSVSHVSGYDEGMNLLGTITPSIGSNPIYYSLIGTTKGFNPAESGLAWAGKLGTTVAPQLFISGSYFRGSQLPANDGPDLKVANLSGAPTGATTWKRTLWEADVRYGYGKNGTQSIIGSPVTQPFQFAGAFGRFNDQAVGAADRKGNYWYAEALYNATEKLYLASRYSTVKLDDGYLTKLDDSPEAVNSYNRLGLGVGYRLAPLTQVKAEYTINNTSGAASAPSLNQFAVGVATKF